MVERREGNADFADGERICADFALVECAVELMATRMTRMTRIYADFEWPCGHSFLFI
jgi:hypothetical protein